MADNPWPDLAKRAASAVVLAALALGSDWFGGWIFVVFWAAAALTVQYEWHGLLRERNASLAAGLASVLAASILAGMGQGVLAGVAAAVGIAVVFMICSGSAHRIFAAFGVAYAAAIVVPVVLLRGHSDLGGIAILFLFAIVWGTDIMAYFVGRSFGGPKLWPAISPKKTWSGFVGGLVSGTIGGLAVAWIGGLPAGLAVLLVALGLSAVSQAGDLFESWFKRRCGAKDASHIIPGHGGVMDRLDGFVAASTVALAIGLVRNGADPAAGLLSW